jgi:hypothetical protein
VGITWRYSTAYFKAFGFGPEITGTHLNPKLLCPKTYHCMSSVWRFVHKVYAISVDVDYRFV